MTTTSIDHLAPLIGTWELRAGFPGAPPGRATFEWFGDRAFLVQRSEVSVPEAPDGFAFMGHHDVRGGLVQHYFDSRGVARLYDMTFDGRTWTLERTAEDHSPLKFAQRYVGELAPDGSAIRGRWEIAHDLTTFELDFTLDYVRLG